MDEETAETPARVPLARRLARPLLSSALLAGGAALLLGGLGALARSDALRIRTIRFHGLVRATADELVLLSPVKPGDPLLRADLGAAEQAMGRHPWVRQVEIHRRFPPALDVRVVERTAVALVDLSGLYLVDDEGNVFKRAAAGDGLDLPLVTGISRADYARHRESAEPLLRGALALAQTWRERRLDGLGQLSEVHVDPGDGTTIYVGEEGTQVRLGSGDLQAKLSRLERVLSAIRAEGKRAEVLHLDDRRHPDRVAVRLAGTSPVVNGGGPRGP